MGREIDKQKLKIRLSSFWPLLILIVGIGLNSQKIQGQPYEDKQEKLKHFTHRNPNISKCIREYSDLSENHDEETTMQILQNIFLGVNLYKYKHETWNYLAQFYGPQSQWRRAHLSLLYCTRVDDKRLTDLNKCLDTLFHAKNGHLAKLEKITPNYEKSIALFKSLIMEKELVLARKLGAYLKAKEKDLEMIFDILLGRTRWELYRIVEHFEKEFSHDDKFRKNDPEKCSLSSYFSRRIKKDPINKYAYELLEKRVNQVYNQIQFDEKKVKRQINEEIIPKLREFCTAEGNYKKDYAKIAEQIDALLEIIDFGSPVAVHFVKEFEKLNCEAFFTYEMKKPYYFSNFNIEKRQFYQNISLRKTILIMSGLTIKEKYLKKQAERWIKMNLRGKYDDITTFLVIHMGQDLGKILEYYKKFYVVDKANTIAEMERQFGSESGTLKMSFSNSPPKFDAYISLMKVVNGRNVDNAKPLSEPSTSTTQIQPKESIDLKCYGESEDDYEKERAIGKFAYEQLQIKKMARIEQININQYMTCKMEQTRREQELELDSFRQRIYSASVYKLDLFYLLKGNLTDEKCLSQIIVEERNQFCVRLHKQKNKFVKEKDKKSNQMMRKYLNENGDLTKKYIKQNAKNQTEIDDNKKRIIIKMENKIRIRTRFLVHLIDKMDELKKESECPEDELLEELVNVKKEKKQQKKGKKILSEKNNKESDSSSSSSSSSSSDENVEQLQTNTKRVQFNLEDKISSNDNDESVKMSKNLNTGSISKNKSESTSNDWSGWVPDGFKLIKKTFGSGKTKSKSTDNSTIQQPSSPIKIFNDNEHIKEIQPHNDEKVTNSNASSSTISNSQNISPKEEKSGNWSLSFSTAGNKTDADGIRKRKKKTESENNSQSSSWKWKLPFRSRNKKKLAETNRQSSIKTMSLDTIEEIAKMSTEETKMTKKSNEVQQAKSFINSGGNFELKSDTSEAKNIASGSGTATKDYQEVERQEKDEFMNLDDEKKLKLNEKDESNILDAERNKKWKNVVTFSSETKKEHLTSNIPNKGGIRIGESPILHETHKENKVLPHTEMSSSMSKPKNVSSDKIYQQQEIKYLVDGIVESAETNSSDSSSDSSYGSGNDNDDNNRISPIVEEKTQIEEKPLTSVFLGSSSSHINIGNSSTTDGKFYQDASLNHFIKSTVKDAEINKSNFDSIKGDDENNAGFSFAKLTEKSELSSTSLSSLSHEIMNSSIVTNVEKVPAKQGESHSHDTHQFQEEKIKKGENGEEKENKNVIEIEKEKHKKSEIMEENIHQNTKIDQEKQATNTNIKEEKQKKSEIREENLHENKGGSEKVKGNELIGNEIGHLPSSSSSQSNILTNKMATSHPPKNTAQNHQSTEIHYDDEISSKTSPKSTSSIKFSSTDSSLSSSSSSSTYDALYNWAYEAKNKASKMFYGGENTGKISNKHQIDSHSNDFKLQYSDGKYFVNGKMTIFQYIKENYLNKIYDPKMAVKCFKICEEFEKIFNNGNIKRENGKELDRREIALINAQHKYCTETFKKKHMEKTFEWMKWMADALLQFLIIKGHYPNFKSKFDRQEERKECQKWFNELKNWETGNLVNKIKQAFEFGINCRPEMEELWVETYEFCRNGKKSNFELWIGSNFKEPERDKNLKILTKQCAHIDMSSLSMHWCPTDKKYEMAKGESAQSRQEFILKLAKAFNQIEIELKYSRQHFYKEELKEKCGQFIHKISNANLKNEDIQSMIVIIKRLIAKERADLPVLKCFDLIFVGYNNEMDEICNNSFLLRKYEQKAEFKTNYGEKGVDQMSEILKNCNEFKKKPNVQNNEVICHHQIHHGQISKELMDQIRSQLPSLPPNFVLAHNISILDRKTLPERTESIIKVKMGTEEKVFHFDENGKLIPLTEDEKKKSEYSQYKGNILHIIPEDVKSLDLASSSSSLSATGH